MMRYLLSPVFAKELKQISNRRSFPYIKIALFFGLFFSPLIYAAMVDARVNDIVEVLAWSNAFAIMIVTPIAASAVIAGEMEARTLPLLFLASSAITEPVDY